MSRYRSLPLASLIEFCHLLRVNLGAGIRLVDVMRQLSTRSSRLIQPVAGRMLECLERGDSFRKALKPESAVFPPLFSGMVELGEKTGHLPEVLEELERHYQQQLKLRRQLRSRTIGPAIQFFIAIGVIALLIFILGAIADSRGGAPPSVMGFRGAAGAVEFLVLFAVLLAAAYGAYRFFTGSMRRREPLDGVLLRLPVIGPCMLNLAMSRFALAMRMTLDSSMPISKALRLSFEASGNAAFAQDTEAVVAATDEGLDLTTALSLARFMPDGFLPIVASAEEAGKLVDTMRQQAAYYHEEASRHMKTATRLAAGLIWSGYAVFMVFAIFRIASSVLGGAGF